MDQKMNNIRSRINWIKNEFHIFSYGQENTTLSNRSKYDYINLLHKKE